jgi:FKBP-type peptidyl-prolyl cis-trans isomerase SlpA
MVKIGDVVKVHYTGKLSDGTVFDSSLSREPIEFSIGNNQVIYGFEQAVIGKEIGDKVTVNIKSEEAYGSIREDLFIRFENSQLPGEVFLGQSLVAKNENGFNVSVVVKEINEDHIIVDANHPLAGKDLIFDIEIMNINENPSE